MKPANSVLMRSSDTESAGTTAPQCRESFYLFRLSTLTGADQIPSSHYSAILIITHNMRPVSSTLVHFGPL